MSRGGYKQINNALNACVFGEYLETQLQRSPKLEDVEQISPRVIRVLGQNAGKFTLQGTNTYIVGTGDSRLMIDTGQGIPEWAGLISSTLSALSITISHVLLTHWHGDHTGGVSDIIRLCPQVSTAVYKNSNSKSQQPLMDGQVFQVEGATIRTVHSPGHSHDHMCFILEEETAMFTGDNILGHGTSAVEDLGIFMSSLRAMQSHGCTLGYPAHGAVILDLPAKISGELAQKVRREKQVLQTLERLKNEKKSIEHAKLSSVATRDLVTSMHGSGLNEEVRKLALEPFVDEMLRKLAGDGRVGFEIREGEKKWFSV